MLGSMTDHFNDNCTLRGNKSHFRKLLFLAGLFKPGEPPFQDCHYHINSALDTSAEGPQSAALKCELLNSSLAQIHNLTQQDFLINLILNNFEYHSEVS